MSCDENKEARARDREKRRSLPVVQDRPPDRSSEPQPNAPRYWRSLEERDRAQAIVLGEFAPGVDELPEGSFSRRGFMQLVGASTALATVGAACRKPNEKIIPFVRRPEEVTPGNPLHFATAYALEGFANGLLVTSFEGRPTKVEGNPEHPGTAGATTAIDQALIMGLYDDDRAKQLRNGPTAIAWHTFLEETKLRAERLAANQGAGLRFLIEPTSSPTLGDQRRRILERFPKAKFVSWSSTHSDGAAEGPRMAFGQPLVAQHHLEKAQVVLSLDADF